MQRSITHIEKLFMKKLKFVLGFLALCAMTTTVHAQVTGAPTLYDQNGGVVNAYDQASNSLTAGWYYSAAGQPLYYYANGVSYDPATQTYSGNILYPNASGPQSLNTAALVGGDSVEANFTPGVPNTGYGGRALYAWTSLLISAAVAVVGTHYLTRSRIP
jgi:hypothetical protein